MVVALACLVSPDRLAAAEEASPGESRISRIESLLDGVTFMGDLRLRYEGIFDDTALANNRGRFRLRLGFSKKIGDIALVTVRGATGSSNDPTSTNQSFEDNFTPKTFHISLAYASIHPWPWLDLQGGKMPVPFAKTDLVWDDDLTPEGLSQQIVHRHARGKWFFRMAELFFHTSAAAEDGYLIGYQAGFTHEFSVKTRLTIAPAYTQVVRPNRTLAVGSNGNMTTSAGAALASQFRVINVPVRWETAVSAERPLVIDIDLAKNQGAAAVAGKTYDQGFLIEMALGRAKTKGDWMARYRYARIESDAVLSAFNDSDFGFTNVKGHRIAFDFVPVDVLKLTAASIFTDPVISGSRPARARVQFDASFAF